MLCPVCKIALTMSERQGIEIDYCPQCRGVWLDRGELDKIIERSQGQTPQAGPSQPRPVAQPGYQTPPQAPGYGYDPRRRDHDWDDDDDYRRKRKKNWLEEIFD